MLTRDVAEEEQIAALLRKTVYTFSSQSSVLYFLEG